MLILVLFCMTGFSDWTLWFWADYETLDKFLFRPYRLRKGLSSDYLLQTIIQQNYPDPGSHYDQTIETLCGLRSDYPDSRYCPDQTVQNHEGFLIRLFTPLIVLPESVEWSRFTHCIRHKSVWSGLCWVNHFILDNHPGCSIDESAFLLKSCFIFRPSDLPRLYGI